MLRVIAFLIAYNVKCARMTKFESCGDIWQTICAMICKRLMLRSTDFLYIAFSQQPLVSEHWITPDT